MPLSSETQELFALFNTGRFAQVESRARLLAEQYPDSGIVWKILGASIQTQGKNGLPALQKAVELLPEDAETQNNVGVALQALGQLDEALASYRRAVELKPDFAEAHNNVGNALEGLGQVDGAVASYRKALDINPDYAQGHVNLGNALQRLGQFDGAVARYRHAVELKPDYAEAHSNLGGALRELGQLDGAVASCRRALEIKPDFAEAHLNLGNALRGLAQIDAAVASYRKALDIKPGYTEAHSNLGHVLLDLGQLDGAVASYHRALEIDPDFAAAHSNLLFGMNYLPSYPPNALKEEARRYGDLVAQKSNPFSDWPNPIDPSRQLNVGLVSGDLYSHPVGFFTEGVVAALARDRMRLFVYQTRTKTDQLTERLKRHIYQWTPVTGITDRKLAEQIRRDGIDILIDLAGHNAANRLPVFAWKPAPIQVTWLGYFATTGVPGMDYILVDPWSAPPNEEDHFTEEVWRLPETRLCFTPPEIAEGVGPLPALLSGHVTFGCFGNLVKINDAVLEAWARVLEAVPGSRLFLKAKQLNNAIIQEDLRVRFSHLGIAGSRMIFEGPSVRADYLAAYHRVDFVLDTFPFPGGTTTIEALWMGVPVLTLKGDRLLSHQGESLLMNAGIRDWIATDVNDYVARAVHKASDLDALAQLRADLRKQVRASPLFDARRFAGHFEAALRAMWQKWCSQQNLAGS